MPLHKPTSNLLRSPVAKRECGLREILWHAERAASVIPRPCGQHAKCRSVLRFDLHEPVQYLVYGTVATRRNHEVVPGCLLRERHRVADSFGSHEVVWQIQEQLLDDRDESGGLPVVRCRIGDDERLAGCHDSLPSGHGGGFSIAQ